jgi:hypothetical protein
VHWFGAAAEWGERTQAESMAKLLADAKPRGLGSNVSAFGEAFLPALLKRVPMPMQRPVVRRGAMDRIGHYRADCLLWDCDWVLRASMAARCAYLDEPLYRQRLDGQGTSSRGDRETDHFKSGLEIACRLYRQPPVPVTESTRQLLRRAASDSAASLAYHYAQRGLPALALGSWWDSLRIRPSLRGLRFPVSLARASLSRRQEE